MRGDDPAPVPDAAVQIGLADLEQVAGPQERAAAEIAVAGRHEVPVIAAELERPRHIPLEIFGQPGPVAAVSAPPTRLMLAEQ